MERYFDMAKWIFNSLRIKYYLFGNFLFGIIVEILLSKFQSGFILNSNMKKKETPFFKKGKKEEI